MSATPEDPDELIAHVQEQIAQAQERAEAAGRMRAEVNAVRGTAYSPRRELSVTVDAAGRLVGVDLSDAALALRAADLSRLLVTTAQAAQRDAGEQAVGIAGRAFGEDSPIAARLRAELDERETAHEQR